jgi:CRP-like cAMP-binding protein
MNQAQALKKTFLFADFSPLELDQLASVAREQHVQAGQAIFIEGDQGNEFYVIVLGTVTVTKNRDGSDEEMATLGSGSYFGEMAVCDDDHLRSATVVAKEATTLLAFAQPALEKLFAHDHAIAHHFFRTLARGLSRRLRSTTQDAAFYRAMVKEHHHH